MARAGDGDSDGGDRVTLVGSFASTQFLKFLLFSGLAAAANFLVGLFFYNVLGWDAAWSYKLAVMLGFVAGMVVSFALNRAFTFARSGRRLHQEMHTFVIVSLGGLLLTVVLAASLRAWTTPWLIAALPPGTLLARLAGDAEATSHFLAIGLVAFYSFTSHRLFTFDKGISYYLRRLVG
ncbi:MAG: GtrA family protein [Alphaproteobacteria bacterium]|nr:GtrA family protein [Alphaproteobacteria bacterium]